MKFTKCQSSKQSGFGQTENRVPNSVFSCSYVFFFLQGKIYFIIYAWITTQNKRKDVLVVATNDRREANLLDLTEL